MSLDVYLHLPGASVSDTEARPRIFVREEGRTREISREEWDWRYPGVEPVTANTGHSSEQVFHRNITHNLNRMAEAAGIYQACWRPGEIGISYAKQLASLLREGLDRLRACPDYYRTFNPTNGWGTYEGLLAFVEDYWRACETWPEARIAVSR